MKISRKLFNEIFEVHYYNNEFERIELDNEKLFIPYWNTLCTSFNFVKNLRKIGFKRYYNEERPLIFEGYAIYIKKEYIDSIKNLMDLALSDDIANHNVAYQIFQNIKQYSITK